MTYKEAVQAISLNRNKGASLLTDDTVDLLLKLLKEDRPMVEVEEALITIYISHSLLAPLMHLIALYIFSSRGGRDSLIQMLEQWKARLAEDRVRAVRHAVERLKNYKSFATLSHSSFVLQAFSQLASKGKSGRVFVGESRPGGEGTLTAGFLARLGFEVILTPDSLMPSLVEDAEILVLGVDALSKTFYIHKSGTRPTVIGARLQSVPVCTILTADKWLPSNWESLFAHQLHKLKEREQTTTPDWIEHRMRFDLTPANFVDILVTPEGEYSLPQLIQHYENESPLPWSHMDLNEILDFLINGGEPPSSKQRERQSH